jgi:hypothetical protein
VQSESVVALLQKIFQLRRNEGLWEKKRDNVVLLPHRRNKFSEFEN